MTELDPSRASDRTEFARRLEEQRAAQSAELAESSRLEACRFYAEDNDSIVLFRLRALCGRMQEVAADDAAMRSGAAAVLQGLSLLDRAADRHIKRAQLAEQIGGGVG